MLKFKRILECQIMHPLKGQNFQNMIFSAIYCNSSCHLLNSYYILKSLHTYHPYNPRVWWARPHVATQETLTGKVSFFPKVTQPLNGGTGIWISFSFFFSFLLMSMFAPPNGSVIFCYYFWSTNYWVPWSTGKC